MSHSISVSSLLRAGVGVLTAISALAGCGGDMPATMMATPLHGIALSNGPYTVPAGTEKYFCFATTLHEAAGIAVNQVEVSAGASVHHLVVFQALAHEPEGFTECPVLIKSTWLPLYAGGRNTPGLTLPAGAGFKLDGDAQILVQLHVLNATTKDASETTSVKLHYAADPTTVTPAGIFALGTMNIMLPAQAQTSLKTECMVNHDDLNVFAAFPHMHKLGTSIVLERGTSAADARTIYQRNPWTFGDQPMDPLPLTIHRGEFLRSTCSYNNTTDKLVSFGESTNDEMCYMVVFYTPFNHLDGCIQ